MTVKIVDLDEIKCIGCGKAPHELPKYVQYGEDHGMSALEYVIEYEGTFNTDNGHFVCTDCYIRMGMPSSPTGWKAP